MLPVSLQRVLPGLSSRTAVTRGPIGVEFGVHRLRLVQMERNSNGVRVTAFASLPYPESRSETMASPAKLAALIRPALRKHGFRGRSAVTCLLPDNIRILILHYLVPAGQTEPRVILQRVAERVDGSLDDYVLDYVPVRNETREGYEQSALVAIARKEDVTAYLELLRKAGLNVEALEIGPVAIRRLVATKMGNTHEDNVLVITLGQKHTYMTVLSGRRLIFDREVSFGEVRMIERICGELDLRPEKVNRMLDEHGFRMKESGPVTESSIPEMTGTIFEVLKPLFSELVSDINKALVYTASETHGRSIQQVFLTGAVARWKGIDALLGEMIRLPVKILDPLADLTDPDHPIRDPRAGVVTGLALRGLDQDM